MSHHVSASPSNPTGAVEVVRVSNSATSSAPVDSGGASGPASTAPAATPAAGQSGSPGAVLPVEDIEQASATIQSARADLARTTGAERRLDAFDGVGGGGGGGGGAAGQENANNAEGAVAQNNPDVNAIENERQGVGEEAVNNGLPQTEDRANDSLT